MENIFEKLQRLSEEDLAEIAEVDSSELDEFDVDDLPPSSDDFKFQELMIEFLSSIVAKSDLTESFINKHSLEHHYYKHCLAGRSLKSKRANIYYDFDNIIDYKNRAKVVYDEARSLETITIISLLDKEFVLKAFRKLFEGGALIAFSPLCGITDSNGTSVGLVFKSFANEVTTNYDYNTIDYMVVDRQHIKTIFPVDANYLQNKFNNIIQRNFPELIFPINGPHRSNKYL